ncbi:MAG: hypothetical protein HC772_20265 [Leptolyngbyaceae cyanobacterium CRU_2_3]|nr:hypothetical protein [Leptolyngbyaceae cyanobacterium CRU_2_3]
MNALTYLFVMLPCEAIVSTRKTIDQSLYCSRLEARGSGRLIRNLTPDRLEARGSGRVSRPVFVGLPA